MLQPGPNFASVRRTVWRFDARRHCQTIQVTPVARNNSTVGSAAPPTRWSASVISSNVTRPISASSSSDSRFAIAPTRPTSARIVVPSSAMTAVRHPSIVRHFIVWPQ